MSAKIYTLAHEHLDSSYEPSSCKYLNWSAGIRGAESRNLKG